MWGPGGKNCGDSKERNKCRPTPHRGLNSGITTEEDWNRVSVREGKYRGLLLL